MVAVMFGMGMILSTLEVNEWQNGVEKNQWQKHLGQKDETLSSCLPFFCHRSFCH
jgi:hypothetical protein